MGLDAEQCKHAYDADIFADAKEQFGYSQCTVVQDHYKAYADTVCNAFGLQCPPVTHQDALFMYFVLKDDGDSLLC